MRSNPHPPMGRLIEINGHQLHICVTGEGSPTVVLESGGSSWSLDWYLVQAEVAKFTKVCSYDRAGFGWSQPGPMPRSSAQIVSELQALLVSAKLEKPYILVGASFGGHIVRLFAHLFPEEVAGIVLLDARHEDLGARMPSAWKNLEVMGKGFNQFLLLASRTGLLHRFGKLLGGKAAPPMLSKLPPDLRPVYLEAGFHHKFFQSNLDELAAIDESDVQLRTAGSLGDIPLTVIRHGIPDLFAGIPAGQAEQAEAMWQQLQEELACLSSNSRLLTAEKSGHRIQMDEPALVVEAIHQIVEEVCGGRSHTQILPLASEEKSQAREVMHV